MRRVPVLGCWSGVQPVWPLCLSVCAVRHCLAVRAAGAAARVWWVGVGAEGCVRVRRSNRRTSWRHPGRGAVVLLTKRSGLEPRGAVCLIGVLCHVAGLLPNGPACVRGIGVAGLRAADDRAPVACETRWWGLGRITRPAHAANLFRFTIVVQCPNCMAVPHASSATKVLQAADTSRPNRTRPSMVWNRPKVRGSRTYRCSTLRAKATGPSLLQYVVLPGAPFTTDYRARQAGGLQTSNEAGELHAASFAAREPTQPALAHRLSAIGRDINRDIRVQSIPMQSTQFGAVCTPCSVYKSRQCVCPCVCPSVCPWYVPLNVQHGYGALQT